MSSAHPLSVADDTMASVTTTRSTDLVGRDGELRELARTINRLRARIGEPPFPLHEEFEAARGRTDANDPGEPKQAQAWLKRLAAT